MVPRAHRSQAGPAGQSAGGPVTPVGPPAGRAPRSGRGPRSGPALPSARRCGRPPHGTRRSRRGRRDRDAGPSGGGHRHPPAQAVPGGADCGSAHLRLTEQEVRLSPGVGHDPLVGQFPGRGGHQGPLAGGPSARTSPAARPRPGTSGPRPGPSPSGTCRVQSLTPLGAGIRTSRRRMRATYHHAQAAGSRRSGGRAVPSIDSERSGACHHRHLAARAAT